MPWAKAPTAGKNPGGSSNRPRRPRSRRRRRRRRRRRSPPSRSRKAAHRRRRRRRGRTRTTTAARSTSRPSGRPQPRQRRTNRIGPERRVRLAHRDLRRDRVPVHVLGVLLHELAVGRHGVVSHGLDGTPSEVGAHVLRRADAVLADLVVALVEEERHRRGPARGGVSVACSLAASASDVTRPYEAAQRRSRRRRRRRAARA